MFNPWLRFGFPISPPKHCALQGNKLPQLCTLVLPSSATQRHCPEAGNQQPLQLAEQPAGVKPIPAALLDTAGNAIGWAGRWSHCHVTSKLSWPRDELVAMVGVKACVVLPARLFVASFPSSHSTGAARQKPAERKARGLSTALPCCLSPGLPPTGRTPQQGIDAKALRLEL